MIKQIFHFRQIVYFIFFFIPLLCIADNGFCDVVYLKNKDTITGEVIEQNQQSVSVKTQAMGVISIKRDFVERIVRADVIYLKNKDKITGEVLEETVENVSIKTEAIGIISVKRDSIERISNVIEERIAKDDERIAKEKEDDLRKINWKKEISIGYNQSSGNTESSQFTLATFINRKTKHDEFTIKGDIYYSSSNEKMDAQRWSALVRNDFNFWENKWYNFYQLEADHDRFANVDYRLLPSTGVGYRFSDTSKWKAKIESGLGFEHTSYRDATKDSGEATLIGRGFLEKKLFDKHTITQDITLYPSLEDTGQFRLHSETSFISPINEKLSLRFSFVDDYDSDPQGNIKKNDLRFTSFVVHSF